MKRLLLSFGRLPGSVLPMLALVALGSLTSIGVGAEAAPTKATTPERLQTNLVSDLPGVAAVEDPNLVNPWGISESAASPFWISDNGAGLSTLYQVPGAGNTPVSITPLVVSIPTPVSLTSGTPTGTVFNNGLASGAFRITGPNSAGQTASAPAVFLFATEDGSIAGWNPGIDPTGQFAGPSGASTHAVIAVDNSGNNFTNPDPSQQTGAVYKGLAIATSSSPIVAGDANSTALLYASNFRAGTIEVYDAELDPVTGLPADAFRDPGLPAGYAPFNVQILNGKVYIDYALQDATGHDDVARPHHGFVDVFNLDGTPGLPAGAMRLISRGPLDSPWGLAIAPEGFGGLSDPSDDPVLLVGNFGNGLINAFDTTTGSHLGQLKDPDGEPIQIDGLWALKVGNDGNGGAGNTVYFTAGLFNESHGLFGSLATVGPGLARGTSRGAVGASTCRPCPTRRAAARQRHLERSTRGDHQTGHPDPQRRLTSAAACTGGFRKGHRKRRDPIGHHGQQRESPSRHPALWHALTRATKPCFLAGRYGPRPVRTAGSFADPDQGTAAVHLQLTGRLAFQLADGSREVTGEEVVLMNVMVSAMSYS